jgi:hypothetical protein
MTKTYTISPNQASLMIFETITAEPTKRLRPDGETEERSYWTQNPATTLLFIPHGKPVIIRTKHIPSKFHKERFTNDFYTTQPVPIEQLEVLVNDNWMPVNQIT